MQSMLDVRYIVRLQFRDMMGPIYVMMMHLCDVMCAASVFRSGLRIQ